MSEITVREIIVDWLKSHGCDGLAGDECGCGGDDLLSCEICDSSDCVAARMTLGNDECRKDCYGECVDNQCYRPATDLKLGEVDALRAEVERLNAELAKREVQP